MPTHFIHDLLCDTEIRLISIENGEFDQPLKVRLDHVRLDTSPEYIALSYVWGNPDDTIMISVNGARFPIIRNLFEALRQERYDFSQSGDHNRDFHRIWADAICIDQSNEEEKAEQVLRMADIYQSATRVAGWLGTAEHLDPRLIKLVFRWADEFLHSTNMAFDAGVEQHVVGASLREVLPKMKEDLGTVFQPFLDTLLSIFQRPFFTRVWIVQEAVLANPYPMSLHIDGHWTRGLLHLWLSATGDPLLCQKFLRHKGIASFDRIRGIRDAEKLRAISEENDELVVFASRLDQILALSTEGAFEATRPHDYVYGLLSIADAPGTLPKELLPDYAQSYWQVYWTYSKFIIEKSRSLLILSNPGSNVFDRQPVVKDADIPSWVPDLRHRTHHYHVPDAKAVVSFSMDCKMMRVKGISFGKAIHVVQPQTLYEPWLPTDTRASNIRKNVLNRSARLLRCSRKTIYQSWLSSFHAHEAYELPLDDVDRVMSWIERDPYEASFMERSEEDEKWEEALFAIMQEMEASLYHHAHFVTKQGYVGSLMRVSERVQPTDIVCLFYGMTSGALLRPFASGFHFVGVVQWRCPLGKKKFDERFFAIREPRGFEIY